MSDAAAGGGAAATPQPQGGAAGADGKKKDGEEDKDAEEHKKTEEEPISLGGPPRKKKKLNAFYDPPLPRPDEKFDVDVKKTNELVRRWKVHIKQIEVGNLQNAVIDGFVQFIIGGTYFVEVKKQAGGRVQYLEFGERGIIYQTEVQRLIDPSENPRQYTSEIVTEFRASYFEIMQQQMHVELWNTQSDSGLFLNHFIGFASLPLIEISTGNFKQSVQIFPFGDDVKQIQLATISFNIYFEEIWDFYLTFMDWKATSLENTKDKSLELNPQVAIKLISPQAIQSVSASEVLKKQKIPHWALFENGIKYRGTYTDLRQEKLQIQIWNHQILGKTLIGSKTVPLKNCLDLNFLKTEMVIHKTKKRNLENIRIKAQTCGIQGTLRVGQKPKYAQSGEIDVVAKQEQYLAVYLQRLAVFDSLDDGGGDVTVFATVDWAGAQKRSKGVRRPNVNETLLFHIALEDDVKVDQSKLAEFLNDELSTKSEITINVWADTGKQTLENLGSGKVCLNQLHYQKFEDKVFTDEKTKQKISFQCRVYTTILKLQSAFFDTANSAVTVSVWFQPEVPYPAVDFSKLRPKEEDVFPSQEIEHNIKNGMFLSRFQQVLSRNFPPEFPVDERRFDNLFYSDQYRQKHLLPLFLSKITPPDSNIITFVQDEEKKKNDDGERKKLTRGIRTLSEVAHYVRCIPFRGSQEYQKDRVWSSPDFVLTMRLASVEEHAILLASMFRAVKYETTEDIYKHLENADNGADNSMQKKKKKKGGLDDEEDNSLSDRVFVCLGRTKDSGLNHAWVMTINKTYDEVTFWESSLPTKFKLRGRIQPNESVNLQGYLSPNLSDAERKEIDERRELKRQESSWYLKTEQSQGDMEFSDDDDESQRSKRRRPGNHQDSNATFTDDEKESDRSFLDDVERVVYFEDLPQNLKGPNINHIGKIKGQSRAVQYNLKQLDYLSASDSDDQNQNNGRSNNAKARKPNKFLDAQNKERLEKEAQREDKHLLPIDEFIDPQTDEKIKFNKPPLPYATIDLIFNHKNVWANLQNQHPGAIYYHIHDEEKWLPLIADPAIPHPKLLKAAADLKKQMEASKPQEPQGGETAQEEPAKKKKKKKVQSDEGERLLDCQMKGDFLKIFASFYDPKGMDPPISFKALEKLEQMIEKDVEIAIKQVRSAKNFGTKIRKRPATTALLKKQLNLFEDFDCDRILHEDRQAAKEEVEKELLKLIPENYRIAILPAYFNYSDPERIRTIINDEAQDFLLNRNAKGASSNAANKKLMFAIGVQIYAFHSQICSVRVAIARMCPLEAKEIDRINKKMAEQAQPQADPENNAPQTTKQTDTKKK